MPSNELAERTAYQQSLTNQIRRTNQGDNGINVFTSAPAHLGNKENNSPMTGTKSGLQDALTDDQTEALGS